MKPYLTPDALLCKEQVNPRVQTWLGLTYLMSLRFALVKYGGGIVQLSGSIAGNVFARNRFGDYARSWKKPVNPHSDRQEAVRARLSYLAEYWHDVMTPVQRGLWDTYAAAVMMKNRLGDDVYLTGFNHFIRSSMAIRNYFAGEASTAPTILSLPEKDPTLVCSEENIAGQTFTFTFDNGGWAPDGDTKMRLLLFQGQPQLASRNFYAGPWRYMHAVNTIDGALGTDDADAVFSFAVGQKVWFQARILTLSARLTEVWTVPPRTIVADP